MDFETSQYFIFWSGHMTIYLKMHFEIRSTWDFVDLDSFNILDVMNQRDKWISMQKMKRKFNEDRSDLF